MINDDVELNLRHRLKEDFGVSASGIDIGVIEIDKTSEGYARLVADTLVREKGMTEWQKAGVVEEVKALFGEIPPAIPKA